MPNWTQLDDLASKALQRNLRYWHNGRAVAKRSKGFHRELVIRTNISAVIFRDRGTPRRFLGSYIRLPFSDRCFAPFSLMGLICSPGDGVPANAVIPQGFALRPSRVDLRAEVRRVSFPDCHPEQSCGADFPQRTSLQLLNRGVKPAEYDVDAALLLCLADAEIRNGAAAGNHFTPLTLPLLSLKCKSDTWDSRSKPVPIPPRYAHGASATGTVATYQNGCSTCGESR